MNGKRDYDSPASALPPIPFHVDIDTDYAHRIETYKKVGAEWVLLKVVLEVEQGVRGWARVGMDDDNGRPAVNQHGELMTELVMGEIECRYSAPDEPRRPKGMTVRPKFEIEKFAGGDCHVDSYIYTKLYSYIDVKLSDRQMDVYRKFAEKYLLKYTGNLRDNLRQGRQTGKSAAVERGVAAHAALVAGYAGREITHVIHDEYMVMHDLMDGMPLELEDPNCFEQALAYLDCEDDEIAD